MNWRRGLFRLWIVGSALFVLAVAGTSYSDIKQKFNAVGLSQFVLLPVLCGDARGVAGKDYTTREGQSPGPWDSYANPSSLDNCWYGMSKFRPLYPEYKDLSDNELRRKLYAMIGVELYDYPPNPWATIGMWASIALGVPLVVLALGSSLVWAFSGFAAKQN
jgi:hypothetical protein